MRSGWWLHSTVVVASAVLFMAVAAWQSLPWWEYAFLSDDSPVAWLSSALLVANAAVAFKLTLDRSLSRLFGGALSMAFVGLALDEQFMLHEWFKYTYASGGATAGLVQAPVGDLPALFVGLGGLLMLIAFVRVVSRKPARGLMVTAVVVGVFALWVDLGSAPVWLTRTEEGYEVLAESLTLCALLEVARGHVHSSS